MKIILFSVVFLILYFIFIIKSNNMYIDIKSFFYKGFKKIDNEFRLILFLW